MPFTTGPDGRVGEAVAAAAARAADRRDTDVLVGGVFISVSSWTGWHIVLRRCHTQAFLY